MLYPYNTIFGRGLLNTFEVALQLAYLCLKVPATFRVITIFGSQKEARNIEQGFALGDEDINTSATIIPSIEILGPIT
jgi:hypothetical protein